MLSCELQYKLISYLELSGDQAWTDLSGAQGGPGPLGPFQKQKKKTIIIIYVIFVVIRPLSPH